MHKFLISLLILFSTVCSGQEEKRDSSTHHRHHEIETAKWDTTYYHKYDYVFIVGIFQSHRDFSNEFAQEINKDKAGNDTANLSNHLYYAESNLVTGFVFNYDKFQLSFGTRSEPPKQNQGKGYTKTFNLGFNFGDNRWVSENYYRRFEGFYDKNTPFYDTAFKRTGQYYLLPHLTSSLFMTRLMYFQNHEQFSFKSGFGCNYRQMKSAATWILGGSYNAYHLRNDSSIFPVLARPIYNDYGGLKGFSSYNFGVNVGLAGTLVLFKAWFISGYFTLGPEQQWRSYDLAGVHRDISYISFSGTFRASFGINMKHFYMLISTANDYNLYNSPKIVNFKSNAISQNFTIGLRFHTGMPPWYRKFQETKFYKLFS
jgi:hypothetical protein